MPISSNSSDDDEKYIDKDFLAEIDAKIAAGTGAKILRPLSRGGVLGAPSQAPSAFPAKSLWGLKPPVTACAFVFSVRFSLV